MKCEAMALVLAAGCGVDGHGFTVRVALSDAPLAVVAYRDGDGEFATLTPTAGSVSFDASSGRYTVAVGCPLKKTVDVYQGTVEELAVITHDRTCLPSPSVALSGQFNNNGTSGQVVKWGQDVGFFANFPMPSYMTLLTEGTHDLVATRNAYLADRVVIERAFSANTASTVDVDFAGPLAITLSPQSIQANGIGLYGTISNTLVTSGGTVINLSTGAELAMVMPESSLGAGDFQILEAFGQTGLATNVPVFSTRHVVRSVPTMVALPMETAEPPTVTPIVTNNQLLVAATWPAQPAAISYTLLVGSWTVQVSAEAFATHDLVAVPDLTGVVGWDSMLALVPPQGTPARFKWTLVAESGVALDDAWRIVPVKEGILNSSGWSGESQLE